ncbi:4251_t:CDS:2 [Diversispora eburnea]|uniref:4251_t:CDS:1 n=1 Tax=Diversispora eburnea TaxID=1213867 RepID=A0A9N9AV29_9GLOM|nr:4251_t:CDS:2 [Diversispora eburnea]
MSASTIEVTDSLATIESNLDIAKNTLRTADAVGGTIKPFVPLIENTFNSLMDRVNAAEATIKTLKRRQTENEKNFHFDVVITELHFTMAVANGEQRRIDQITLESDIANMTKFLERIEGGISDQNQMKEALVACKPITPQNSDPKEASKIQQELSILEKLRNSPKIIRFYGLSHTENSDVMVFEWADHGSLRELYSLDICRGLTFLHPCDILHHDIRCEHIMMATGLVPKIAKFKYSREASGPTTDMKGVTDIMRWMAPEKLLDSTRNNVPYSFKCEIFRKNHVGNASPNVQKLQKGLAKIIMSVTDEYCSPDKESALVLLPDKTLDLDGSLSCSVSVSDEGGSDLYK